MIPHESEFRIQNLVLRTLGCLRLIPFSNEFETVSNEKTHCYRSRFCILSDPRGIQTPNPQSRNLMRYSVALWGRYGHVVKLNSKKNQLAYETEWTNLNFFD